MGKKENKKLMNDLFSKINKDEIEYEESEYYWWYCAPGAFVIFVPIFILITTYNSMSLYTILFCISFELVAILLLMNFYVYKTLVLDDRLILKYGIGLFSKKVNVNDIEYCEVYESAASYGWGGNLDQNLLWQESGSNSVQIKLRDNGYLVIKSRKPKKLCNILNDKVNGLKS